MNTETATPPADWLDDLPHEQKNPFRSARIIGEQVSNEAYRKQDCKRGDPAYVMSRGELMQFAACPSKWLAGCEDDETDATFHGSLVDCLVLMPGDFPKRYAVTPTEYPVGVEYPEEEADEMRKWNGNAAWCKAFKQDAESDGIELIGVKDFHAATQAAQRLFEDSRINECLKAARFQVHVQAEYEDAETKIVVPVKCLIDAVPTGNFENCLVDLKTCRNASRKFWTEQVDRMNYDAQGALYLDAWNACLIGKFLVNHEPREYFLHILSENVAPYQIGRRWLSAEFLKLGRAKYVNALKLYCACLKSGEWPGYDSDSESAKRLNGWSTCEPTERMMLR